MKLYDFGPAGSARRVRLFLAEKNLDVPMVQLNVREDEQFKEPFNSMNPFNCVPFLELDDGSVIAESISICRYLDEVHPDPSLFGRTAQERANIDMWNRRVELDGYMPMLHAVRNHVPMFAGRVIPGTRTDIPQSEEMIQRGQQMLRVLLGRIDPLMQGKSFIAGPSVSVADITAWFTLGMANMFEMDIANDFPNMHRWFNEFSERDSVKSLG